MGDATTGGDPDRLVIQKCPLQTELIPQQRSGDVRPATAECLASTNVPRGSDTYHLSFGKSLAIPNPAYPRTPQALDGAVVARSIRSSGGRATRHVKNQG